MHKTRKNKNKQGLEDEINPNLTGWGLGIRDWGLGSWYESIACFYHDSITNNEL
jgi:hypothetical protein